MRKNGIEDLPVVHFKSAARFLEDMEKLVIDAETRLQRPAAGSMVDRILAANKRKPKPKLVEWHGMFG